MSDATTEDSTVLVLAEEVLTGGGYRTKRVSVVDGAEVLLAENEFAIIALSSVRTTERLRFIESGAAVALSNCVAASNVGAKRWDAYLVLLVEEEMNFDDRSDFFEITRNTSLFRRIVRVGVTPELESVKSVLSMFLPLADRADPTVIVDALALLQAEMPAHGVSKQVVDDAMASFRSTGEITNE